MEQVIRITLYAAWGLWLAYGFLSLFRKDPKKEYPTLHSGFGTVLVALVLVSLYLLLSMDLEFGSNYFIEKYEHHFVGERESGVVIGSSDAEVDITLHNASAADRHLRLTPAADHFSLRNISTRHKVDVNGRYLNKLILAKGDQIQIKGKEKIEVKGTGRQFPLGRSIELTVYRDDEHKGETFTLHTLLNKPVTVSTGGNTVYAGFKELRLPGGSAKPAASITYETHRSFLHMDIYYVIAFLTILLLSIALYLYLKNLFNGGLLLLLFVSLPFMAGFVPPATQGIITLCLLPLILYTRRPKASPARWKAQIIPTLLYASLLLLPLLLRMDGDFTLRHYDYSEKDSIGVFKAGNRTNPTFLQDIQKQLKYEEEHTIILGHTSYRLMVARKQKTSAAPGTPTGNTGSPLPSSSPARTPLIYTVTLVPVNPEILSVTHPFKAVIGDLREVENGTFGSEQGGNFIYLKYPHRFTPIPAAEMENQNRITITGTDGNTVILSRHVSAGAYHYLRGLILLILLPFLGFLIPDQIGIPIFGKKRREKHGGKRFFKLGILNRNSVFIYQVVFLFLGLGYVVFGALAMYNSNYFKNFEKYRDQALPLFVILFFGALFLSRYNRRLVFAYRLLKQKKYYIPLVVGLLLIALDNYSNFFFHLGVLYLIYIYGFRLRKDIVFSYKSTLNHPLDIKQLIEHPISDLEEKRNRNIIFGLGRVLYRKGWNYFMVSDLLLLLALFFIVLQVFLGGELGVSVAGFFFLPIELGKILLTIYFADWVSRIDRGMELNVMWIYALVLVPFFMLVFFLKDFSPLLVFSFVFLYHIFKIKKPVILKLFMGALIYVTMVVTVAALNSYTLPMTFFSVLISVPLLLLLIRQWGKPSVSQPQPHPIPGVYHQSAPVRPVPVTRKVLIILFLFVAIVGINYFSFFHAPPAPPVLGSRISSWLNPWQDYNLSYQYVNSLWLMKGTGLLGKPVETLNVSAHVPLIEKDLSFSLYVSVLGYLGAVFIFLSLFLIPAYVNKMGRGIRPFSHPSADPDASRRWHAYLLEFLTVIFLAQFIVPALYVVGLLPIMGQPLPFLSYSNNILLLFALPFSLIMILGAGEPSNNPQTT